MMLLVLLTLSLLPTVTWVTSSLSLTDIEKPVPIQQVSGLQGTTGVLPCDVSSTSGWGDVFLILWFKDNATKPMYSLDVLGRPLGSASQWAATTSLGRRSTFRTNSRPALLIADLVPEDQGMFRCRVDYKNSPTKHVKIQLTVIVPPGKPVIRTTSGAVVQGTEIGPFEVGGTMEVTCYVTGGSPLPAVTWWKDGSTYDDSYDVSTERENTVTNSMTYSNLKREDLGAKFTCQASNTNRTPPVSREIHISLNLRPTGIQILEKPTYVSEGKSREVTCQAMGGFPPPDITWWIGTRQLMPQQTKKEYQGVATSRLHYLPDTNDDGRYLTCRVLSEAKMEESLEDTWEIKVLYKPRVSLRLGKSLDPDNLRTGNDVYFECDVKANPAPHKLVWLHNGSELIQNQDAGIVMSTQSLVLQRVGRHSRGEYECKAVNSEGTSSSNPVNLNIMFSPICNSSPNPRLLGISFRKPSSILCEVEAYPAQVNFRWFFNSSEYQEWKETTDYTQTGLKSQLEFLPKTSKDYGHLFCIAENDIGVQAQPCIYHVVPTGKPSKLTGCQVINKTLSSLKVECHEGFDGGLPANFLLELYDRTMTKMSTLKNKVPIFEVSHVDPTSGIKIYLYANNSKGESDPFIIEDVYFNINNMVEGVLDANLRKESSTSEERASTFDPSLILMLTAVGAVFLLCISVTCVFLVFRRRRSSSTGDKSMQPHSCDQSVEDIQLQHHYGSNPDLIPVKSYPDGCQYLSDLDSTLLLGGHRASTEGHSPVRRQSQKRSRAVVSGGGGVPVQCSDTVSYLHSTEPGDWSGGGPSNRASIHGGTLDRGCRGGDRHQGQDSLYHTCARAGPKKKVTIIENADEESEV